MKRTPLARRTRLSPVSQRRRSQQAARREVLDRLVGGPCEGPSYIELELHPPHADLDHDRLREVRDACTRIATEGHEPLKRSRGGDPTDPAQVMGLCHNCHRFTEDEPRLASLVGLLRHSWERP